MCIYNIYIDIIYTHKYTYVIYNIYIYNVICMCNLYIYI